MFDLWDVALYKYLSLFVRPAVAAGATRRGSVSSDEQPRQSDPVR